MIQDPRKTTNLIKKAVIITFVSAIIVFVFIKTKDLLFGISIKVYSPKDGDVYTDSPILVQGNAKHSSFVSINDRAILIDKDGNFSEDIVLPKGYSVLEITTRDNFGREKTKNIRLFYNKQQENKEIEEYPTEDILEVSEEDTVEQIAPNDTTETVENPDSTVVPSVVQ